VAMRLLKKAGVVTTFTHQRKKREEYGKSKKPAIFEKPIKCGRITPNPTQVCSRSGHKKVNLRKRHKFRREKGRSKRGKAESRKEKEEVIRLAKVRPSARSMEVQANCDTP